MDAPPPAPDPIPHDDRLIALGVLVGTFTRVRAAVEHDLEPHGLTGSEFEVLVRIARAPGVRVRMSDLARQIIVSSSGLTRVVDRLSDAGLVVRIRDGGDRRVFYACLTDAGRTLIDAALPEHLEQIDRIITGVLDPDELEAFLASLRKIRAAASASIEPATSSASA